MKHILTRFFLALTALVLPGALVLADCKSDYKQVQQYAVEAEAAQKKGKHAKARSLYKKAARRLAVMKYQCSSLSLKDLNKQEKLFRQLAKSSACGPELDKGQSLYKKGKAVHKKRKQANVYYQSAADVFQSVVSKCRGTAFEKVARKKIQEIKGLITARRSSKVRSKVAVRKVKRVGMKKNLRVKRIRYSRNPCFRKYLGYIVAIEKRGYAAYEAKNYTESASRLSQAARLYEKESSKCTGARGRLAALDRAKALQERVAKIKKDHVNCDEKIGAARNFVSRAYKDERSGEFDLAQQGYENAFKAFSHIPQVCSLDKVTREIQDSRTKSKLLKCKLYISGIKAYSSAISAMSSADKAKAKSLYELAARNFGTARKKCEYDSVNHRLLQKLERSSVLKSKRLGI